MNLLTADDPETRSADPVADNIAQLKALFPEAFTEGKIDFAVLRQLLGDTVDDGEEKYGLNWHGKRRARRLALTPSAGTLRPCPEESVDWDTTQNLMIEGDNLEVLKLLQKSYAGKVKLIYIDPPYNTGNDFIYSDDYRDGIKNYLKMTGQVDGKGRKLSSNTEASGRFHTDWLSMMYPRLKVAWTLLRQDGCIFISIDDHESSRLRAVCDEIFGEENFLATIIWQKVFSPKNTAATFSEDHEYLIAYARRKDIWKPELLERSEKNIARYQNPDSDPRGVWMSGAIQARNPYGKGQYQVTSPSGKVFSNPKGTYWRFSKEKFQEYDNDNRIWWGENGDGVPRIKRFLSEVRKGVIPQTFWKFEDVGHTQEAKEELLRFVEFEHSENVLNSLKPSRLIRKILQVTTLPDENELVLDFFAGSGTTGHAVLAQNHHDNGNRRFVLVQIAEPLKIPEAKATNICDLAESRLRAVANGLDAEYPRLNEGVSNPSDCKDTTGKGAEDRGFKVFKLDSSNIKTWEPNPDDLEQALLDHLDHIKEDRTEQDLLYELLLKRGIDLCAPAETRELAGKQVYSVADGELLACLAERIEPQEVEKLSTGIADWISELGGASDVVVVFRDSAFANDVAKTNCTEILKQRGIKNVRSI